MWALRAPGREGRFSEPPEADLQRLIECAVDSADPHLGASYSVFGHCSGAFVAIEIARELAVRGHGAPENILAASPPPSSVLAAAEEVGDLASFLARHGATDPTLFEDRELLELVAPALRADVEMLSGLEAPTLVRPASPVTFFYADDLADGQGALDDMWWIARSAAPLRAVRVSVPSFYGPAGWDALACEIRSILDASRAGNRNGSGA